jgi:hypothetical protein
MKRWLGWIFVVGILFSGCSYTPPPPVKVTSTSENQVNYLQEVKPILDRRCVTCHSCYNSPCQLKLSSFEGLDRGASKITVYDSTRLRAQDPTRLFIDAQSTDAWRQKSFYSMTDNSAPEGFNNSIMMHMLHTKTTHPAITGEYKPETETLVCPRDQEEMGKYLDVKEHRGMPYGFPAITDNEYAIMMQWLDQGAHGPSEAEQHYLITPSSDAALQIAAWEAVLNDPDPKHQVTARYLYEHLFLAHIYFDPTKREFFELVRSRTPSPQPIDVIATPRPYENPGKGPVYYRFQKIHSTIVYKTHILFDMGPAKRERITRLFLDTPWFGTPYLIDYSHASNVFLTYAQIPPQVRYQFLLDHSEYFVRTFIRGPVCKGQVALNAIQDHFWVLFQDPDFDLSVQRPDFLITQAYNLATPDEMGSDTHLIKTLTDQYIDRYNAYFSAKQKLYDDAYPNGLGYDAIWHGDQPEDAPMLTIYRHFDSATVMRGAVGELPRTGWVIDYPQFERLYYALVAGFDVFGNLAHMTNVRRYMDYLRMEGELNLISYMPKSEQLSIYQSWYIGDNAVEDLTEVPWKRGTQIAFKTNHPKQELFEAMVNDYFLPNADISFDLINYFPDTAEIPPLPKNYNGVSDYIQGLQALTAPGTRLIEYFNNSSTNVAFVRIKRAQQADIFMTILVNRWHNNVNTLFSEASTLDPTKDTLDFHFRTVGAYPNVLMVVDEKELPAFFDMLANFQPNSHYFDLIHHFAISRSNPNFWETYDWFQTRFMEDEPMAAGLYDLNRYYPKPW